MEKSAASYGRLFGKAGLPKRSTFSLICVALGLCIVFLWIQGQASRHDSGMNDSWHCKWHFRIGMNCIRDP